MAAIPMKVSAAAIRQTAKEFESHCEKRRFKQTYLQLLRLFRSDLTFEEIGKILGVTKQAAHQVHDRWFAQYLGPGSDRIKRVQNLKRAMKEEAALQRELKKALADPVYQFISSEARAHDVELVPVVEYRGLPVAKSSSPVYRAGNRYVRVYHRRKPFSPNPTAPQSYASFQISLSMLKGISTCVLFVDIPGYERELYIVRASVVRRVIAESGDKVWSFYVALGSRKKVIKREPIKLAKSKDAWWVVDL